MNRIQKALRLLLTRPSPEDVQSVLASTQLSMCVIICLAFFTAPIAYLALGATFTAIWFSVTIMVSGTILIRAQGNKNVVIRYVSRRLARRLLVVQFVLAMPFSALLIALIGYGVSDVANYVAWPPAGMAAGGAALLRRTLAAAVVYFGTLIGSAIVGIAIVAPPSGLFISICILIFGVFLFCLSAFMGETERERDRNLADLSAAVSDLERARDENHRLANVDPITGLANRKALTEALEQVVQKHHDTGQPFALISLDLDRFKNVNDTFGHAVGDQLIAIVGARLQQVLSHRGTVGRLGGDEFAAILPDFATIDAIDQITRDILDCVSEPADLAGRRIYPGTSVGVALCPKHGRSLSTLLLASDVALNRAKEVGRGTAVVFDKALSAQLIRTDKVEAALRKALVQEDIHVHYQPKVCLKTGAHIGAEALMRWREPELGAIPPTELLHIASERGLMPALSRYLVARIGADILSWRRAGLPHGTIAINVHPVELKSPELLLSNIQSLKDIGVTARDLVIEVTEGCFVGRGNDAAKMMLDGLADEGYDISLDDFGTGHASLSHLRGLPVKELKIDRTFVTGILENKDDRAIVAATTEIARGMGIRSVAEGVEASEEVDVLRELGVEIGQGYFWARPLAPSDFTDYLSQMPGATPIAQAATGSG